MARYTSACGPGTAWPASVIGSVAVLRGAPEESSR
jgi:hypothetical protein